MYCKSIKIKFEGVIFVATVVNDNVIITNEILLDTESQMFFHLKEVLREKISEGEYCDLIKMSVKEEAEYLYL